jgi:PAS domain S-box-containing protein
MASGSGRLAPQLPLRIADPTRIDYFKDIVGTVREPLLVLSSDLRVLAANRSFFKFFKVKQKETVGELLYDLGNRQWDIPALRLLLETILPQKAVFNDYKVEHDFPFIGKRTLLLNARRIPAPPKEALWILLAFEDVTERMRLEGTLQASEMRFRHAFETASDSMLLVDKISGQVLNSNRAAQDSFGYSSKELLKKNLWELGILKDRRQFRRISIKLEEQGVVGLVDTTIPTGQGGHFPADLTMMDRAEVIQCNIRDTTQRRRVEEELSASEQKFRTIAEQMTEMIYLTDEGGIIKYVSPAVESIFGYTLTEMLGHHFTDFLAENDIPKAVAAFSLDLSKKEPSRNLELSMRRKAGSLFTGELNGAFYRSGDTITGTIGFIRDITERKLAEGQLRESEKRLSVVFNNSYDQQLLISVEPDGELRVINVNDANLKAVKKMGFDITENDFIGKTIKEVLLGIFGMSQELLNNTLNYFQQAITSGKPVSYEESVRLEKFYYFSEVTIAPVFDRNGKCTYALYTSHNITERKRAEVALGEREEHFRTLIEHSQDAITLLTADGTVLYDSPSIERVLGYIPTERIGRKVFEYVPPEDHDGMAHGFAKFVQQRGAVAPSEMRFLHKDGTLRHIEGIRTNLLHDPAVRAVIVNYRDITERKQAEELLRESERKVSEALDFNRKILETTSIGILTFKQSGQCISANSAAARITGGTVEQLLAQNFHEIQSWKKSGMYQAAIRALDTGIEQSLAAHIETTFGKDAWLSFSFMRFDSEGERHLLVFAYDITERKQAEEALSASEARFRSLYENATIGIYRTTPDGQILMCNPALVRMLGYETFEEISRRDLKKDEYEPEYTREEFQERLERDSEVQGLESAWKRKDGSTIYVRESAHLVRNEMNLPLYYEGTVEDITARKQVEEKLDEERILLRTLIDSLPDRVYAMDVQGRKTLSNIADWQASGGKSMEDVIGKTDLDIYPPELAEKYWATDKTVIDSETPVINREEPGLDSQGNPVWVLSSKVPLRDGKGRVTGLVGTGRDITDRKRVEEELKQSEERYRQLVEFSPDGVAVHSDGKFVYVNPAAASIYGASNPQELLGKPMLDRVHPAYRAVVKERVRRLGEGQAAALLEEKFLQLDGSEIEVEVAALSVRYQGKPAVQMVIRDIAERKKAEDRLSRSEQRYRGLFEDSPISLWEEDFSTVKQHIEKLRQQGVTDFHQFFESHPEVMIECVNEIKVLDVNKATLALMRAENKGQLIGNLNRIIRNRLEVGFMDELVSIAEGRTEFEWEGSNYTLDGEMLSVSVRWSAAPGYEDSLGKVLLSLIDITARNQAEENLRISEDKFSKLFHSSPDAILLSELNSGRIIEVNTSFEKYSGYTRDELIGHPVLEFNMYSPADRQMFVSMVKDHGSIRSAEFTLKSKTGQVMTVMASAEIININNEPHTLTILLDITARKQAEQEILQLNASLEKRVEDRTRELREAQEQLVRKEKLAVLGQLAGGVGHELRNPLSVISTSIYYLKLVQPDAGEKIKQHQSMIEQEVHNADKIISDLLDFGRVISAEKEPVSVPGLVQKVLNRFPAPASVKVSLDLPADLPQVLVDGRQVEQVLGNLVMNACQAMVASTGALPQISATGMPGGGRLTISAQREKEMVAIAVKDTGTGITPENMKKLFEPLFTTKAKGIGLGLAVSRKLAEANGGRIEVQSEVGKGSTFTLYLCVYETDKQ